MLRDARARLTGRFLLFRPFRLAAGIALALLALVGAPRGTTAATVNTTADQLLSIPLTQTNWEPGLPPTIDNPLVFDKFNPALGPLQSVNISLNSDFNHDIVFRFIAPSTLNMQTIGSSVSVKAPDGSTLITASPPLVDESRTITGGPFPQTVVIPTITQSASTGPLSLSDPATLAMFTATAPGETIALPAVAVSSSSFSSSSGNGSGSINSSASANVIVSYTYVPEPSTLLLVGLGFASCARWASRNRPAPAT